ncbi:MAG: NAD(P) transhydrogenase subunit alpha [Ruminococcaceae bacterium]|nr:NAD(P) transhydrogenase subunit alpha [Oscillospiraceae bacterium]
MIIGIPKEIMHEEARVSATPDTVKKYVDLGAKVLVETNAGKGAYFPDEDYAAAGAEIVTDVADLYAQADIILKVKEPLFNEAKGVHEIDMMHSGQYIITFIHPASPVNHEMVKNMAAKGVISITLDGIPRISRAQSMDALTSMSTCAGYKGMLMAADRLPWFIPMTACAVGVIKPANVLVLGAGVAGMQALATAKRLGSITHAGDIRPMGQENATSLGAKLIDLGVPPELAVGPGGYALRLPEDVLAAERERIAEVLPEMDIVFCSALVPGKLAPILITEEMVKLMKHGSVLVDIAIDQGGNCDITPKGTIEVKHGVTIIGTKNIPGLLPTSSTWMFANNMYELVKFITKDGQIVLDMEDEIIKSALTTIDGKVVHAGALEAMAENK